MTRANRCSSSVSYGILLLCKSKIRGATWLSYHGKYAPVLSKPILRNFFKTWQKSIIWHPRWLAIYIKSCTAFCFCHTETLGYLIWCEFQLTVFILTIIAINVPLQ